MFKNEVGRINKPALSDEIDEAAPWQDHVS